MASTWSWEYLREGVVVPPVEGTALAEAAYPTQSDAESWIGETWRDLVDAGVDAVRLFEGDTLVYGPMSLLPA